MRTSSGKEVLINILSNVVKFTEAPGSITLSVEQTATHEDMTTLHFRVRDTGIGIFCPWQNLNPQGD